MPAFEHIPTERYRHGHLKEPYLLIGFPWLFEYQGNLERALSSPERKHTYGDEICSQCKNKSTAKYRHNSNETVNKEWINGTLFQMKDNLFIE
ncbi:hypothetical protein CIT292_09253 [Citrobacter youngae ATCC 29220]|uniref:Uncharacterized protein n=1 Tax=Citrobacter youngae ATCC 29220 TaxID=500640 RepID=D4BEP0_9ENTR|nr:hypothetical protein CIT292_09253 [Citrobacter youngae ATCC 29220]